MSGGRLRVRSFGVVVELAWDDGVHPDAAANLAATLPPGATPTDDEPGRRVTVRADGPVDADGRFVLDGPDGRARHAHWDGLLHAVERDLASYVALHSPDAVFFHAGAVGTPRGAILLPGRSFAGKTTLVSALLRAGCSYLSDEYAVVDAGGLIHPYPRRLSIRGEGGRWNVPASELGARVQDAPLLCALVASVTYDPDADGVLTPLDPGRAALALVDNAVAALTRPREVLLASGALARGAVCLAGRRSDADAAARQLLDALA
ncbi:hypothetical protein [Propioniciclava tarda]|uniref:Serine kinase n=1 Tax=Propioniciclava tarda TaxID=433330 RepID=A0A4Q9KNI8_PROTD|nr:hypothetical protein [Propioniciclava tarda]TBT96113.1 hypothetical protein ET996_00080 [Propioniciclava tarda]SMO31862.1 hypothetical protein SAMN06266982_10117 [Propioniciclava tarda]